MYRIDDPSAVASRPAATALGTEGWFLRGIPGSAQGTVVTAEHKNMVQAEMEGVRALNPVDPGSDKTDDEQMAEAIREYVNAHTHQQQPYGMTHSITAAGTNEVTVVPGECRDELNAWGLEDAVGQARQMNTPFSVGGIGGLAIALSKTFNTWYSYHALWKKDGTKAYGWDSAANYKSAANLLADAGAGWDYHRRLGWHRVDDVGSIVDYVNDPQNPHEVRWNEVFEDWSDSSWPDTDAILRPSFAPPRTLAHVNVVVTHFAPFTGGEVNFLFTALDQLDVLPSASRYTMQIWADSSVAKLNSSHLLAVGASSEWRFRASDADANLAASASTSGYQDFRIAQL